MKTKVRLLSHLRQVRETGSHEKKAFWRIMLPLATINLTVTLIIAFAPWHLAGAHAPDHWDFSTYYRMAQDWMGLHDFHLWSGEVEHQFPPLWPMLLSPFTLLPGGIWSVFVGSMALNLVAMLWMIGLTGAIFERKYAIIVGCLVLLLPYFAIANMDGFGDTFTSAAYLGTIACLLLSLKEEKNVRWAGAFAGVTYLLKASMGYFIIIAGLSGLLWRYRHRGSKGITSKYYLQAMLIFGAIALPWIIRNVMDFGVTGWETQPYMTDSIILASKTQAFWHGIGQTILTGLLVVLLPLMLLVGIQLLRGAKFTISRGERFELYLTAIILPLVIGCIAAAAFDWREGRPYNDGNLIRYIMPVVVPISWVVGEMSGQRNIKEEKTWGNH